MHDIILSLLMRHHSFAFLAPQMSIPHLSSNILAARLHIPMSGSVSAGDRFR
jgi:hypothetical protein